MPLSAILSDYNGTIIRYPTEGKLWKYVGMEALKDSAFPVRMKFKRISTNPMRAGTLLAAILELNRLKSAYDRGEIEYDVIYRVYNERVLRKLPIGVAEWYITCFAHLAETEEALDDRVIRPLRELKQQGIFTGVVSTGSRLEIEYVLRLHDNRRNRYTPEYNIMANNLVELPEGGCGFALDVNEDNKSGVLRSALETSGADPRHAVYIDDKENCFGVVGHPVVSFFAEPEFKKRMFGNAFIPETEDELRKYLDDLRTAA